MTQDNSTATKATVEPATLKGMMVRCVVDRQDPILLPPNPELWNERFVSACRVAKNALALCVADTADSFQVLYDEMVWDAERSHFMPCMSVEEWESELST